ncbi:ribokinase [Rothia uropygialis]|uniref:ribokinase n=1 Tax=Kocuria sp. 36 TaxID=1415402 RepID=UPI0013EA0E66|nr:ribokinase [Kocuria sp. 36]
MARPRGKGEDLVKPEVFVVGSVSRDVTVTVEKFPAPGETVVGHSVTYGLGGKGANQAVASALTGVPTSFLGCVGTDEVGKQLVSALRGRGVRTERVVEAPGDSGSAHITVDALGENMISIVPAANRSVSPELIQQGRECSFDDAAVVMAQGEIPIEALEELARAVAPLEARLVLNLAPAVKVSAECLAATDVLMVNESEAAAVLSESGSPTVESIAQRLTELAPNAVVTLGEQGSVVATREDPRPTRIQAFPTEDVVDTTGAGDAYAGVFAAALAHRVCSDASAGTLSLETLATCATIASREAAKVVEKAGASSSYSEFSLEEQ